MNNTFKYCLALVLLFILAAPASAQHDNRVLRNLPTVDRQRWHFGFILGVNFSDFLSKPSGWIDDDGNTWYSASSYMAPAFTVGMITDLRVVEYLNIRFTPQLSIGSRTMNYSCWDTKGNQVGDVLSTSVTSTTLDVPIYIKYSAKRYGNFRPYIIVGAGPQFNLNIDHDREILLSPFDVQVAFGFGFNLYTRYFKLCPELKFGFGVLDQMNHNHPEFEGTKAILYTNAVDKLTSRVFMLTFNFE